MRRYRMANFCNDGSKGIDVILPANTQCLWTIGTQTGGTWTVNVKDADGTVLFTQTMGGNQLIPQTGVFNTNSNSNYTITLTSNVLNKVLYGNYPVNMANTVYSDTWIFIGEDSTDNDYNDVYFSLTWFTNAD